ncbi:MAG TPA: hypothetical protein DEV98_05985 [Clostridiales bacterium]|nr:hypothetical protein [Clostridiales bacterium]
MAFFCLVFCIFSGSFHYIYFLYIFGAFAPDGRGGGEDSKFPSRSLAVSGRSWRGALPAAAGFLPEHFGNRFLHSLEFSPSFLNFIQKKG